MEQKIQYGLFHTHTENSMKDSCLKPTELVKTAAELGCPAVALTDHGNLLGVYEFMAACEEYNVQGVPGVEAYISELDETRRSHMVLVPKDYTGYQAISKAVTKSNQNLVKGIPVMNFQLLEECFGVGTPGHEHVIATSACMGGVIAYVLLKNRYLDLSIEKSKAKMAKLSSPEDPTYLATKANYEAAQNAVKELISKRDALDVLAKKKYGNRERTLKRLRTDSEAFVKEQESLEREKAETKAAAEELVSVKKELASAKKKETILRQKCADYERTHDKWIQEKRTVDKYESMKKTDTELMEEASIRMEKLIHIFGNNCFYVELQYHGIPEEAIVMPKLARLAKDNGIPIIAANDVHFANNTLDDRRARQIIRSLRFNQWEPEQPGDTEYYIKTDAELKSALCEILPENTVVRAISNIGKLFHECDVVFPKGLHNPKFESEDGEDSRSRLRRLAREHIAEKYGDEWSELHEKRLEYELSVIEELGYSDYLCIVEDFLSVGRKLGLENPEHIGLGTGPGRGSGVGSIVCYLTGITGIDPLRHDLLFERFLNKDRVSMPDIDSDLGTEIREKVIDYVRGKYGKDAVCNITTKGTLGAKAAIRNAARILGSEKYDDPKALLSLGDTIAKAIPKVPDTKLSDCEDILSQYIDEDSIRIIADARLIEGVAIQTGMHAAGVIIADNGNVSEYVPLMWNKDNECWCSQCDMVEAEKDAGLLKMDFLGLRNLDIISETLQIIKREHGEIIDIEAIGRELKADGRATKHDFQGNVFDEIFAKGRTNSVFQFESQGMKNMLKRFKPGNIDDIILLVACYRPGPLQYLDDIIDVKHGRKKPEYIVPEMEQILGTTYGYSVYQEQIMQIFNKIAGFSLGEADIIRRYMSKKKTDKFAAYKEKFIDGLVTAGATKENAEDFWNQLLDFSKYAFNKSHATAYAYVAFYTAWLKLNYPAEYMTAVLNHTATDKLPKILLECRELGIHILPPDLNTSEKTFSYRNGDILFGLSKIKGIKTVDSLIEARSRQPFMSFQDYMTRGHSNKTITTALIESGVFDKWCPNRSAMKDVIEDMADDRKKIEEREVKLKNETDPKKQEKLRHSIEQYKSRFSHTVINVDKPEDVLEKLELERKNLGMYISGHPLDSFSQIKTIRTYPISEAYEDRNIILCGRITELRKARSKKDGSEMAFFYLEDETGSIETCCFPDAFKRCGNQVNEGAVVAIRGNVKSEIGNDDEEHVKLNVKMITPVERDKTRVMITGQGIPDWHENIFPMIEQYYLGDDCELLFHDKALGEIRTCSKSVSMSILSAPFCVCEVAK